MGRHFWRMIDTPDTLQHPEVLQHHLTGLVRECGLVTVLVQRRQQQRLYTRLPGCTRCGLDVSHEEGCRSGILERVFRATLPGTRMQRTDDGLVAQPLTHMVLAAPTSQARPLDGRVLHPWQEARLMVWCHHGLRQPSAVALLAAAGNVPVLADTVREQGWRVLPLHRLPGGARLLRMLSAAALPPVRVPLPFWLMPAHRPFVPLPVPPRAADGNTSGDGLPSQQERQRTTDALARVLLAGGADPARLPGMATLDVACPPVPPAHERSNGHRNGSAHQHHHADAQTTPDGDEAAAALADSVAAMEEPDEEAPAEGTDALPPDFPTGPAGWPPHLVEQAVTGYRDLFLAQGGVPKKDIIRPIRAFSREPRVADAVLAWLNNSGIFTPASGPDPWNRPRVFVTTDLTDLATRLRQTPVPEETPDEYEGVS
jgi:hypothetical protein